MADMMRAVIVREHGGPEQLLSEKITVPEPGVGEVRVAVRAVALNRMDLWVRNGIPGVPFPLPLIPGCDVAGVVDAVGPGGDYVTVGSRVVIAPGYSCGHCRQCLAGNQNLCRDFGILGESRNGGCAEFIVVPAVNVFPIPGEMPF